MANEGSISTAPGCACFRYLDNEEAYPDLNANGAIEHLRAAIRCETVNTDPEKTDFSQFDKLHELMRSSYPHVMEAGTFEIVQHSVLITIPGSDPALKPLLLMAHQDVVPVVAGTEDSWEHPPFEATIDETFIWGRGSMDIKLMVIGELEAAEYVLAHGKKLQRTLYLAFGEDEETFGTGAKAIVKTLADRGVRLEFLLDESVTVVRDMGLYGAPGALGIEVELAEKGDTAVKVTVRSEGGHASNPFGGTSLGILSQAISSIVAQPFPIELSPVTEQLLRTLAPYITESPWKELVGPDGSLIEENRDQLARFFASQKTLFPYVTTTCAPTMIEGSSQAPNVMPKDMSAIIDFRSMPGTCVEDVMAHCAEAVKDLPVELSAHLAVNPSSVAVSDGYGFKAVSEVGSRFFKDTVTGAPVLFLPSFTVGGTDAGYYDPVCDTCLRMSPFLLDDDEQARGVHGTNERVTRRSYLHGIRFLIALIEHVCL
ncbi:M20/M25/M40 family metallo-hydrolase [Enorma phocaeensis]|uniref:M20/M25/M40 family metallo-hydrolase n=1 Tax=Enorma phocaeensis TaxID=1871019 RepID=UPI002353745B|nr:M20/M25/M40 family metallo-hydrolase [Enorma phocaeensis]